LAVAEKKQPRTVYIHGDPAQLLKDFYDGIENPEDAKMSLSLILTVDDHTPVAWTYGETPQWIRDGLRANTPLFDFGLDKIDIHNHGWQGPYRGH
jgi:hypothetical protein